MKKDIYKRYFVIQHHKLAQVFQEVEAKLEDGWELFGGISAFFDGKSVRYLQAMTKNQKARVQGALVGGGTS